MGDTSSWQRLMGSFAALLDYPQPDPIPAARECEALSALFLVTAGTGANADEDEDQEAITRLKKFCAFVEETPLGELEEIYSSMFDLDATCHPYVGYHLLGESYKRSAFLVALKERYRDYGFEPSQVELPDHLAIMVRFLSVLSPSSDGDLIGEIVHEALLPTLDRMTGRAKSSGYEEDESPQPPPGPAPQHPYHDILEALRRVLRAVHSRPPAVGVP